MPMPWTCHGHALSDVSIDEVEAAVDEVLAAVTSPAPRMQWKPIRVVPSAKLEKLCADDGYGLQL